MDYHWGVQNEGYAFSRDSWERIKRFGREFLTFHDGWDISLLHLMQLKYIPSLVLLPRLSRVRNIGVTGVTQNSELYEEAGFASTPTSKEVSADIEDFEIGTRILGKDPTRLPYMGPYPEMYHFDAYKPGQLNNNWDTNFGPDITSHWGFRGDWTPGEHRVDGWASLFSACLAAFLTVTVVGVFLLRFSWMF